MEMKQNQIMELLDSLYEKSINGIPKVSLPIDALANDYISKNDSTEKAAKQFVNYQIAKCTTSGFITGLEGLITLPIACLAYMGGYDTNSDQVQTLVYACLAGISIDQIVKQAGIKFGTKFTTAMIKKIPGTVLTKINQKVGFRFLTKFGEKGIINIAKLVPVVGGVIGGGFDLAETKTIANRAYKMFIKEDFSILNDKNTNDAEEIIDVDTDTIEPTE